jgi:hypothetical protein
LSQSTVSILSIFLGIVTSFAFQTGHYLLGAVTLVAHGGLTLYVGPTRWKRALGGLMIAFGLYVLALVLGFLAHAIVALLR